MKAESDQALPITAGLVATTAFFSMLWSFADGWMSQPGWESMGLPGLFLDPNMRTVVSCLLRTSYWVLSCSNLLLTLTLHTSFALDTEIRPWPWLGPEYYQRP